MSSVQAEAAGAGLDLPTALRWRNLILDRRLLLKQGRYPYSRAVPFGGPFLVGACNPRNSIFF